MKVKSAHNICYGVIQYLVGCVFGSVFATLFPTDGYSYAIVSVVMILLIAFVWPFIEVRLIEQGWIKP